MLSTPLCNGSTYKIQPGRAAVLIAGALGSLVPVACAGGSSIGPPVNAPVTAKQAPMSSLTAPATTPPTSPPSATLSSSPTGIQTSTPSPGPRKARLVPTSMTFYCVQATVGCVIIDPNPQTATLTNVGGATLVITSITLTNVCVLRCYPMFFSESNTCPASLWPGESCRIAVLDKVPGFFTAYGTLLVHDNAADSPQVLSLTAR